MVGYTGLRKNATKILQLLHIILLGLRISCKACHPLKASLTRPKCLGHEILFCFLSYVGESRKRYCEIIEAVVDVSRESWFDSCSVLLSLVGATEKLGKGSV